MSISNVKIINKLSNSKATFIKTGILVSLARLTNIPVFIKVALEFESLFIIFTLEIDITTVNTPS